MLPYLPFFWVGVLLFCYWPQVERLFKGTFGYWLVGYALVVYLLGYQVEAYDISYFPTLFSRVCMLGMVGLVFSAAYSLPQLSARLLHGQDYSYGVYLYSALVLNGVVAAGLPHSMGSFWLINAITLLLAALS